MKSAWIVGRFLRDAAARRSLGHRAMLQALDKVCTLRANLPVRSSRRGGAKNRTHPGALLLLRNIDEKRVWDGMRLGQKARYTQFVIPFRIFLHIELSAENRVRHCDIAFDVRDQWN